MLLLDSHYGSEVQALSAEKPGITGICKLLGGFQKLNFVAFFMKTADLKTASEETQLLTNMTSEICLLNMSNENMNDSS